MNYFLLLFLAGLISVSCSQEKSNVKVLKGATVFDGTGKKIPNAVILLEGNKILKVGDESTGIPGGAEIIDVTGKFITPGLVDAHIHFFQTAFFDSRPDALNLQDSIPYRDVVAFQKANPERYYEAYLQSGVTAVYDVGSFEYTIEQQESAEDRSDAPHVAASGPLLTPAPLQAVSTFNTEEDVVMVHLDSEETGRRTVRRNDSFGATGIKVWQFKPEDSAFIMAISGVAEEIQKTDNKLIAHATTLKQAKQALRLGAELLVHSVEDTLVDAEFLQLLKKNNTLYNPTLIVGDGYYQMYQAVMGEGFSIDDPNDVVDEKTRELLENSGKFKKFVSEEGQKNLREAFPRMEERNKQQMETMKANLKKVYDNGGTIVVGTDAGNPGTLHGISYYQEIEAMQDAGIPAKDLIVMATRNGAMAMERLDDFGTLERGKFADLVIYEKDPSKDISNLRSVSRVMKNGEFVPDVNEK